jgi:hypothetical protein
MDNPWIRHWGSAPPVSEVNSQGLDIMRPYLCVLLTLAFFTNFMRRASADDPNSATAVVSAAIQAHGGLEKLAKSQKIMRKDTGVMSFFGEDVRFTDEVVLQLPDRWRWTLEGEAQGQKLRLSMGYNGDKAWQSARGNLTQVDKDGLQKIRDELYVLSVASLVPLKTEKGFTFITLPDGKVNGRDADCILVSQQGHNDLKLFFDKASRLLVKIEAGVPIDKEYVYLDHREIDGVKLPSKYVELTNGKKVVDVSAITYRFLPRLDDSTFEKP